MNIFTFWIMHVDDIPSLPQRCDSFHCSLSAFLCASPLHSMRDWRSLSILGVTFDITFHSTLNVLAVESVNESLTKDRGNTSAALTEAVDKLSLLIHPENFPTVTMTFQMGCELACIKFTVCDWLDLCLQTVGNISTKQHSFTNFSYSSTINPLVW